MSWLSSLFKGKKSETDPYGTLNPEQKALVQQLGPRFASMISGGTPGYTGDYTAPITAGEQEAIDRNARISALGEQGLQPLLKGEFPEDYYQNYIYKPAMKQYTEDVEPLIEEQYAGPGGYWGSARAGAVSKGYRDVYDKLVAERSNLGYQAMKDVPTAIQAANQLSTTEAQMQQIPRLIKQYGLDQQYNEWVRQQGANQNAINQALNFLNISTVTRTIAQPSFFQQMLGETAARTISAVIGQAPTTGVSGGSGYQTTTPGYTAGYKLSSDEMNRLLQPQPQLSADNYSRLRAFNT